MKKGACLPPISAAKSKANKMAIYDYIMAMSRGGNLILFAHGPEPRCAVCRDCAPSPLKKFLQWAAGAEHCQGPEGEAAETADCRLQTIAALFFCKGHLCTRVSKIKVV